MSSFVNIIQDRDGTDYYLKATIPSVESTAESVAATDPVSVDVDVDSDGVVSFDFHIPAASTANADAAAQEARDAADACEAATSAANTAAAGATTAAQNAVNATVDTVHATQDARTAITDTQAATASANAAASAANTAKDATITATTAANEATTAATTATSNANTATANANAATTAANAAATRADASADAADTATDDANAAAARAEEAARPTEEMFASYHALLKAGASEGIASDANPVQSSFLNRASGSAEGVRDGIATIECIKGNTVGWNQLINMSEVSQSTSGITFSASNGVMTVNGTAEQRTIYNCGYADIINGHKYLLSGGPAGGSVDGYRLCDGYASSIANDWGSGVIYIPPEGNTRIAAQIVIGVGTTVSNLVFRPQLFDLTQIFGAGNEPATVEEFEALYPLPYYAYDPGTLKPVNMTGIETVGFNQFDKSTAVADKAIVAASGDQSTRSGCLASDFIDVFPNTEYCANSGSALGSSTYGVCFYDANKQYISGTPQQYKLTVVTSPANARYARFTINSPNADRANFNLHWSGYRDGEYEEYWKSQRAIDVATYFPTGLKSAGSVRDALYEDHADTVVGMIADLSTLNWTISANGSRFYVTVEDSPAVSTWATIGAKLSTSRYTLGAVGYVTTEDNDRMYSFYNKYLYIRDTAYDNVADFKASLAGVSCYYELATPTTVEIDPPLNMQFKVSDFGTERVMLADGVISAPPVFDIAYGYTAESLRDAAASIVAPVENHLAQDNYAIGSYLVRNGVLYKVTAAIARNEAIVPGTNVTATTVMAELAAING